MADEKPDPVKPDTPPVEPPPVKPVEPVPAPPEEPPNIYYKDDRPLRPYVDVPFTPA